MADRPPFPTAPTTWTPPAGPAVPNDARRAVIKLVAGLVAIVALGVALIVADGGGAESESLGAFASGGGVAALDDPGEMPASLWVDAPAIGAVVLLDGDSVGTVPLWLDAVAPGHRRVSVVAPGRARVDTTVQLAAGGMTEVELVLGADVPAERRAIAERPDPPAREARPAREDRPAREVRPARPDPEPRRPPVAEAAPPPPPRAAPAPRGGLRIVTAPAGATVTVDGRRVGRTPIVVGDLVAGTHQIEATMPGFDPSGRTVEVEPGRQTDAVLNLRAQTGAVEVLVRPWGTVAIDGVVRERETDVIFRTQLPVGRHTVRVSHPTFGVAEREVEVGRNVVYRLVFDLEAQTTQADAVGGGRSGS